MLGHPVLLLDSGVLQQPHSMVPFAEISALVTAFHGSSAGDGGQAFFWPRERFQQSLCVFGHFVMGFWIPTGPSGALLEEQLQPSAGWWDPVQRMLVSAGFQLELALLPDGRAYYLLITPQSSSFPPL